MYLVTMVILILGTAGYLLLSTSKYRKLVFVMMGLLVGGVVFSGSRGRSPTALSARASWWLVFYGEHPGDGGKPTK